MGLDLVGVEDFFHVLNVDERLSCFSHIWLPRCFEFGTYSSRMRSVLSQRDMSERMTVSPS